MIVCLCKGVTDRTVRGLVRQGARSLREVGRACEAGRTCGGCRPTLDRLMTAEAPKRRFEGMMAVMRDDHEG